VPCAVFPKARHCLFYPPPPVGCLAGQSRGLRPSNAVDGYRIQADFDAEMSSRVAVERTRYQPPARSQQAFNIKVTVDKAVDVIDRIHVRISLSKRLKRRPRRAKLSALGTLLAFLVEGSYRAGNLGGLLTRETPCFCPYFSSSGVCVSSAVPSG
jgi:hypothetical protein